MIFRILTIVGFSLLASFLICFSQMALAAPQIWVVPSGQKPMLEWEPVGHDTATLKGSRGETIGFQIKIDDLKGCGRLSSSWPRLEFFQEMKVKVSFPSYAGGAPGDYYDPLLPLAELTTPNRICSNGQTLWVWVDLHIPVATPAGDAPVTIQLMKDDGTKEAIQIWLRVWKMTLHSTPTVPSYMELNPWFVTLAHHSEWNDDIASLSGSYSDAMLKHRIYPLKSWVEAPKVQSDANGRVTLDLERATDDSYSFKKVILDRLPAKAMINFPNDEHLKTSQQKESYWKALQNTINDLKLWGRPFVYVMDEPRTPQHFAELKEALERIKKNAPDVKTLVTTPYRNEFKGLIDIWVPIFDSLVQLNEPVTSVYSDEQSLGRQFWSYVSCASHGCLGEQDIGNPDLVLDRPSVYVRSFLWLAQKERMNAVLYYHVVNLYHKQDPWLNSWDFTGNGDGNLFYPGREGERGLKRHVPVPSIRLKLWREASFDTEYVELMNKLPDQPLWWHNDYAFLIRDPERWSRDYLGYQRLRNRIGEYLNSLH